VTAPPLARAAAIVALALGPGCSLIAVDGPPALAAPDVEFTCTTSWAIPVADFAGASLTAAHELGGVGNPDREWTGLSLSPDHGRLIGMGIIAGLVASGIVGLDRVHACRDATAERERQRREQQPAPQAGPTPGAQTTPATGAPAAPAASAAPAAPASP